MKDVEYAELWKRRKRFKDLQFWLQDNIKLQNNQNTLTELDKQISGAQGRFLKEIPLMQPQDVLKATHKKRRLFSTNGETQLDSHMQKTQTYKNNCRCITELIYKLAKAKPLEEIKETTFQMSRLGKSVLAHSKQ